MRKRTPRRFLFLFVAFLALMSLPKETALHLQGTSVALLAPAWHQLLAVKSALMSEEPTKSQTNITSTEEFQKLLLENSLLREEIVHLKNIMQHELGLLAQMESLLDQQNQGLPTKDLKKRHHQELQKLLQIQLQAVPARIIFRPPATWNNFFWINVGTETNKLLGTQTIVKNSPVLVGTAVIGVIDYVSKQQARVRLITDPDLSPSVRAARGNIQSHLLREKLNDIIQLLYAEGNTFDDPKQHDALIEILEKSADHLYKDEETSFLAKGEIHGSGTPLWRSQPHQLKGVGFNYDFADTYGPSRDLRSGAPNGSEKNDPVRLVKTGDTLVTTGLDGVFPPGLPVAVVTKVHPLKEGDYYYELDAIPAAGNMDDLSLVFVIPPMSLEK